MSPTGSTFSPMMILVASATRSTPSVLDTKGKERETRTLHSMTFSWSSLGKEHRIRPCAGQVSGHCSTNLSSHPHSRVSEINWVTVTSPDSAVDSRNDPFPSSAAHTDEGKTVHSPPAGEQAENTEEL